MARESAVPRCQSFLLSVRGYGGEEEGEGWIFRVLRSVCPSNRTCMNWAVSTGAAPCLLPIILFRRGSWMLPECRTESLGIMDARVCGP